MITLPNVYQRRMKLFRIDGGPKKALPIWDSDDRKLMRLFVRMPTYWQRIALALALVVLPACELQWDDVPGAELRPVAEPGALLDSIEWEGFVMEAASVWNTKLVAIGCPAPFSSDSVERGGHAVRLVPDAEWTEPVFVAYTTGDDPTGAGEIAVSDRIGPSHLSMILQHEMGHAIGLDHIEPNTEPTIMLARSNTTDPQIDATDRDVAAAAIALGCAP